ncbi:hypothetical protein TMUPMC115_1587 [Tetragenococcus muriaticus PMC-11-5]|uniref:Uncharacterized protein n=1 Tax=Tetragenococcus muriaticus PMC-11-5 TaxID=1302649 RepID=A0A091BZT5_9ENTE|nr:hypothetical protein TMUPMC115_1587 [Tetragenococcus muriaticus PMC-11-5]
MQKYPNYKKMISCKPARNLRQLALLIKYSSDIISYFPTPYQ